MPDLSVLTREWTLIPSTSRVCLWCGTALSGRQRDYCKASHRKMMNRLKWQSAVGAVVDVLGPLTTVDVLAYGRAVEMLFDWWADTGHLERLQQRARQMERLGLRWENRSRAWQHKQT